MGDCAEETARKFSISRKAQDDYAISSYKRAEAAVNSGTFKAEIVPVHVALKGGKSSKVFDTDEEFLNIDFAKVLYYLLFAQQLYLK
jgi:acetyl-CoA C-acetyltransferase